MSIYVLPSKSPTVEVRIGWDMTEKHYFITVFDMEAELQTGRETVLIEGQFEVDRVHRLLEVAELFSSVPDEAKSLLLLDPSHPFEVVNKAYDYRQSAN